MPSKNGKLEMPPESAILRVVEEEPIPDNKSGNIS